MNGLKFDLVSKNGMLHSHLEQLQCFEHMKYIQLFLDSLLTSFEQFLKFFALGPRANAFAHYSIKYVVEKEKQLVSVGQHYHAMLAQLLQHGRVIRTWNLAAICVGFNFLLVF